MTYHVMFRYLWYIVFGTISRMDASDRSGEMRSLTIIRMLFYLEVLRL